MNATATETRLDEAELLDALEAFGIGGAEDAPSPVPARVGRFRVVREIGRGAMGVVVEAVEEPLGRRVALKLLPRELLLSPAALARFQREAALASRLDHGGICTIYGTGVLDGQPWISMRCVEGESLGKRIAAARSSGERKLRLPVAGAAGLDPARAVASCIARVARALASAHAGGVLHRDVKPSNVMVTEGGEPVLLDFGLAIEPDSESARLTRTGDIAGTPAYLAPELISGEVARSDAQCDVYALGVTLYECLALEPPFRGSSRDALYRSVLSGSAPDLRRLDPSLPRDLAVVVAAAIERDRSARYASAEHLALDLEAVAAHRPIAARPIGPWGRFARWMRREPRQALLAACLAIAGLVAAASAGALLASREKVRAGELAERTRRIDETILRAFLELGDGRHEAAYREFGSVLALDASNEDARVGRVLALLWQGGRDLEALELLGDEPRTAAYEGLRALALGGPPPEDDPAWLATASAHELFLDGERLRIEGERHAPGERDEWLERALERYDEAVLRAPRPRALYQHVRGWVAQEIGDVSTSRSAAGALAQLWPDSANAQYQAGASLVEIDPRTARAYLERAARLDPARVDTFVCLGDVNYHLHDLEGSRTALERALELEPGNARALNGLACVFDGLGCVAEQRAALEAALAEDPNGRAPISLSALSNLALLEWQSGDLGAAADALTLLLERAPRLADQRELLAIVLSQQGHPRHALEQMELALAATPSSGARWLEYSKHALVAGELEKALEAVEVARSLDPGLPDLDAMEAQVLAYLGR